MTAHALLSYIAAGGAASLALAVPFKRNGSIAAWSFFFGMILLAAESTASGIAQRQVHATEAELWQTTCLALRSLLPSIWLCFSLTYSRGNYREFLGHSRLLLAAALLLPVSVVLIYRSELMMLVPGASGQDWVIRYTPAAKVLSAMLLVGALLILMNLERTFRSAVGTMQWRVKFVVLGLALIFGARFYTRSQALAYSGDTPTDALVEAGSLLF